MLDRSKRSPSVSGALNKIKKQTFLCIQKVIQLSSAQPCCSSCVEIGITILQRRYMLCNLCVISRFNETKCKWDIDNILSSSEEVICIEKPSEDSVSSLSLKEHVNFEVSQWRELKKAQMAPDPVFECVCCFYILNCLAHSTSDG